MMRTVYSKCNVRISNLCNQKATSFWHLSFQEDVSISKEDPDDAPLVPAAMTTSDANTTPQQERSLQLAFENAVRARELETALRREQNAETAAFHQACLGTLRQLMQVFSGPHDPVSPEPVSAPTQATSSTTPQDVFTGRHDKTTGKVPFYVFQ